MKTAKQIAQEVNATLAAAEAREHADQVQLQASELELERTLAANRKNSADMEFVAALQNRMHLGR